MGQHAGGGEANGLEFPRSSVSYWPLSRLGKVTGKDKKSFSENEIPEVKIMEVTEILVVTNSRI